MTKKTVYAALLFCLVNVPQAVGQTFDFEAVAIDSPGLTDSIRNLATRALATLGDGATDAELADASALQLAAGRYAEMVVTTQQLSELRRAQDDASLAPTLGMQIFADAKAAELGPGEDFAAAYGTAFAAVLADLDDRAAYDTAWFLGTHPNRLGDRFRQTLESYSTRTELDLAEVVELVRGYAWWRAAEEFWPLVGPLAAADDQRRYIIDEEVVIETPDGAAISAIVVRPRTDTPLPTLFSFTIYTYPNSVDNAKESARHGYVGVVGFTRGKYLSRDPVEPFEHDGADARALIDWISHQPWSDGRVGLYAGSYNGFTQWAVAKDLPSAVKAIMSSATAAPGIAEPMEGGIFRTYMYRWVPYTTAGPLLDEEHYNDSAYWQAVYEGWYRSGRPYRDIDTFDAAPSPIYRRWLEHPSYDAYWQSMIPYRDEFAHIDIPVLQTTGYFDGGQFGTLYYFSEHLKHNPSADHTLLIGPYGHLGAQHQSERVVGGYQIDPVAQLDFHELRYAWFDHVLKGAPRPALLQDRVNFQVMGTNRWRHASSLESMSTDSLRLHLVPSPDGLWHGLAAEAPERETAVELTVDLADRADAGTTPSAAVLSDSLALDDQLAFASDPLPSAVEISGVVDGMLRLRVNKRDLDLSIRLYELTSSGSYLRLSIPYLQRASYLRDREQRQLLTPNEVQELPFALRGPVSRRLEQGSRILLLVGVNKSTDAQVNYGTGKDVSDETIADAGEPLRIQWLSGSFVDLPMSR